MSFFTTVSECGTNSFVKSQKSNLFLIVKISIVPAVQHLDQANGVSFQAIQSFADDC